MVTRSISIVEYKVEQAHFFLQKVSEVELDFFAAQCFIDAFASATRSITFAMQAVITDVPGFTEWYKTRQNQMKEDRLFRFFNKYRTVSTHIGDTVVRGGTMGKDDAGNRVIQYFFMPVADLTEVPE